MIPIKKRILFIFFYAQGAVGAVGYAGAAEVAFENSGVGMVKNRVEGAGFHAGEAAVAFLFIEDDDTALVLAESLSRAGLDAFRLFALDADGGFKMNLVFFGFDPQTGFAGIIHPVTFESADQFAALAAGAELGVQDQTRHILIP
jgi:hypothetical protein